MPLVNDTGSAVIEDSAQANTSQGNVLANDTIVGPLALTRVANQFGGSATTFPATLTGTYGSIVIQADGSYTYTLNYTLAAVQNLSAGQNVSDIFTYSIIDNGVTVSASLTIPVQGSAPTANIDTATVEEDVTFTATGNLLANDTAVGGTLTVNAIIGPLGGSQIVAFPATVQGSYGTLVINANGSYTYTLNNGSTAVQNLGVGQQASDVFTYRVTDGGGNVQEAVT